MKMSASDYRVYTIDTEGGTLYAVADMLAMGYTWPPVIVEDGISYHFDSNEVMEPWMTGEYSGHAKYVEKTAA
jgi:hypothetical protein